MASILTSILNFFNYEPTVYSHRNRTIEMMASEQGLDIDSVKIETKSMLENEGRVETILEIRKRFHAPLSAAWIFVNKLEQ